ncbi:hypothetical protein [Aliikangiella coralliicola]|uniref:Uncharacterized protein n=1 Tax=Aliikangiella coralliicola TaxID=2592383 RepID=A0A545UBI5_9GAMM|nr:hypothetical protein [Aliikangiella coralliicola]TQV86830.1 hypothetical protein FLL46_13495 [Aliikangiella coralliicola]
MNAPQLTLKIEKKILSIIDAIEEKARQNDSESAEKIHSKHYMQLADLYHFHKDFENEAAILKRFARLDYAANDDLVEIYDRIDRVSRLSDIAQEKPSSLAKLELVPMYHDQDKISLSSVNKVAPRVNLDKKPFKEQSLKVLSVCAAYTGRSDTDEVIQLALVLFEYSAAADKPMKTVETFVATRKTKIIVPVKTARQFNLGELNGQGDEHASQPFDTAKIRTMFQQADMVVSHNDAEVERKLIATLIPEVVEQDWYSSQKDIPWGALGFDTKSLTQLAVALGEKTPRSCLERATAISQILAMNEPCSSQVYLERLYNMQAMKPFEWTPSLLKKRKQLHRNRFTQYLGWGIGVAASVAAIGIFGYSFLQ